MQRTRAYKSREYKFERRDDKIGMTNDRKIIGVQVKGCVNLKNRTHLTLYYNDLYLMMKVDR